MTDVTGIIQAGLIGEALDRGPAIREELLELSVTDVVQAEEAPEESREMMLRGERTGHATLTCKNGDTVGFSYRAMRTTVAKLEFWVSVGFVD